MHATLDPFAGNALDEIVRAQLADRGDARTELAITRAGTGEQDANTSARSR
jgi:hypothetical protein